jgi:DHA3 family macrolide efflux protein-like MFS transporter
MRGLPTLSGRVWFFLTGQAFSAIGSWATLVAIWGYAAYEFGAEPEEIGLVGLAWLLPPAVLGPFAGTLIDRLGPRVVLIGAKALGAVASIALLWADDYATLVLFSFGHGVSFAFTHPSLDAFPPRLVDDDHLAATNALLRIATDLAIVLGPVAAAASIALWGFDGAFLFDAGSYLLGIVATLVVTLHEPARPEESGGTWRETIDGLRLVARSRPLRRTMALTGSVYFLYGSALLLEPVYVRDVLDRGVDTFAYLQTAFGVFLVAFGFWVARMGDRAASIPVIALAVIGSALGAVFYLGTQSIVVAFVGVMAWGAVTAFLSGPSRTVLQRHSPAASQGRVLAVDRTVEGVAHLVAMPVAAGLAGAFGVQVAAVVIAALVGAVGVAGWRWEREPAPLTAAVVGSPAD